MNIPLLIIIALFVFFLSLFEKVRKLFVTILGHPIVHAVSTFMFVFAGIMGSVFYKEIHDYFSVFSAEGFVLPNGIVGCFFLLLVFAFSLFLIWQSINVRREVSKARKMENLIADLNHSVRTLPPEEFMALYQKTYFKCLELVRLANSTPKPKKEEREALVRSCLSRILLLFQVHEKNQENSSVVYGANIMTFCDYNNPQALKRDKEYIENYVKFIDPEASFNKMQGFLILQAGLSTNTSVEASELDPEMSQVKVALPIPVKEKLDNTKFIALPGAPLAYMTNTCNRFRNTNELFDWAKKEGSYRNCVIDDMDKYFEGVSSHVQSFISFALIDGNNQVFAVLNIHKNQKDLIKDDEQLEYLSSMLQPLLHILSCLILKKNLAY